MSAPLSPGTVIAGRYRLDRLLGRGGMGQVWAATHEVTLRSVALKLLNAPVHLQPDRRRRFYREARAASAVHHPNVVQISDFFDLEDGTPVMVMDLLEGETLGERLAREQSLALGEAVDVLLPVISAVGTAHAIGIVHRDLKPDNVFLARGAGGHLDVRVLDFGIAKLGAAIEGDMSDSDALTGTGAMLGTPSYMSPEQSFGEKTVDHRTDIWSLGVMLYEALAGTRPIDGENKGRVLHRLATEAITPIQVLMPELPEEVAELVGRMLMRDPADRPEDLRAVRAILELYGTVKVQPFEAATNERLVIDSSPFSARSAPRAVMPMVDACDPRATTYADAPESSSRSSRVEAERPHATVAARRSGARRWFVAAGVIGLVALGSSATWLFLGRTAPASEVSSSNAPAAEATTAQTQQPAPPPHSIIDPQEPVSLPAGRRPQTGPKAPALTEPRLSRGDSQHTAAETQPTARAARTEGTRTAAPSKRVPPPNASASTAPRTPPDDAVEGLVDQPPF